MAFDWTKYLNLAEELVKTDAEENHRSAISRAYYAAYNLSEGFLETCSPGRYQRSKGVSSHRVAILELHKRPEREIKKASQKLGQIFADRKNADYEESISIYKPTAEMSISRAKKILEIFDNWRP